MAIFSPTRPIPKRARHHPRGCTIRAALEQLEPRLVLNAAHMRFVEQAYLDLLSRPADATGLQYWAGQLDQKAPQGAIAQQLTHSAEYYGGQIIKPVYKEFLGRDPDAAGLDHWIGQMQQGLSDERLEADFAASAEFYSHAGGTEVGWVDATYRNLLGRPADAGGRAYWVEQLQQGASRSDVAFGFAASLERESQRVQVDYQHFLRRAASPSELSYWVSQFAAGVTNESLIGGFVGSPEYFQFAQTSPETQPPAIVSTFPADDTSVDVAPQTVLIGFSKAVNASTVTAQSVQLQGPTGPVASTAVGLLAGGTTAQLAYPALAVGEYQLTIHAASITDTTGNGLAGGDVVEHFHVDSASDVWINPAGGDWNAPSNWSTGVVPGPNDDVLINTPGGATIDYSSGFATIKNLTSANPLSVSGGGITFASGASQVDGALSMSNSAQLVALGAGVTFAAKGSVSIGSGAVLSAVGGGLIDLSSLTSFSSTFDGGASISAAGTGSKVELSNLTLLHGSGSGSAVSFSASQGGLVDLSRLAEIPDGSVQIRASDPGSKIDLSALTTFTASGFVSPGSASGDISAVNGGSILVPLLTTARNFSIYLDGRASSISTGQITNIDSVSLSASDGAILDLNGVTSYLATSTAFPPISISAQGPGSIISLPNLIVLHGAANAPNGQSFVFPVFFQATAGGELNLPRLTQIPDGAVQFAASGANSTINLSALATYVGAGQSYSWQVTDGGAIVAPQLSTLRDATLDVDGAGSNISTALLANVDALNINATDGAVVDLNGVTRYAGANGVNFRAGGAGSAIDLSNLTTLDGTAGGRLGINASGGARIDLHRLSQVADGGLNVSVSSANSTIDLVALTVLHGGSNGNGVSFDASQGGRLDLSHLTQIPDGVAQINASDGGSTIDLSSLTAFAASDGSTLEAHAGGTVLTQLLRSIGVLALTVDGATSSINTSQLSDIGNALVTASNGAVVDLNGVTSYTSLGNGRGVWANGTGSKIKLPNLTLLNGLTSSGSVPQFEASAGGLLDLHALVQVPDGSVQFIASDPGSEIVLSALTTLTTSFSSSLEAHNGGMVVCPLVTIVSGNLTLVLDGAASSINTAQLRDIDGVTVYARNGATLDLSGVTTFSPQIPSLPDVEVSGNGSAINLSNLTEMHGPQNGSTAQFAALAGGRLDLHQLARIPDGSVQFVATGANSQIDASGLATFAVTGFGTGFLSVVQATDGGSIDLGSGTTTLSNVEVTLSPSGTLTAGTLVLASGSQLDGSGTLTGNLTNGGVVAPGTHDVTGVITVSGNYVQTAAGTLNVGFDDTGTAVSVDQLIVGGSATLAGTLDLSLLGGFKPSPGNTFTIVSFAFANGTFASVSGTDAGNGHTFAVSYGPLEVKLQVE